MQHPEKRRLKRKIVAKKRVQQQREVLKKMQREDNTVYSQNEAIRKSAAYKHLEIKPIKFNGKLSSSYNK